MKCALFLLLLFSHQATAGLRSWWTQTCERLISNDPEWGFADEALDMFAECRTTGEYLERLTDEVQWMDSLLRRDLDLERRRLLRARRAYFAREILMLNPDHPIAMRAAE